MKCNVNIMVPLTSFVEDYAWHAAGVLAVVRSQGLVVAAKGIGPLSRKLPEDICIGGKSFSIDHKIGNTGEGWSIVVTVDNSSAL